MHNLLYKCKKDVFYVKNIDNSKKCSIIILRKVVEQ